MKKKLITLVFLTSTLFSYTQDKGCAIPFTTKITYSNNDLGVNYNEQSVTGLDYQIFQRTTIDRKNCAVIDIVKPIIIVEGYDILHQEDNQDIYNHYLNPHGLGDILRAQGYDIITVNLRDPEAFIQGNALLLENFIEFLTKEKKSNEEMIIIGVSLGGLLTRYALADIEVKNQFHHQTKLFISFDSPQQGAHLPLAIQAFFHYTLAPYAIFTPELRVIYSNYISDGTKQLIQNHLFNTNNGITKPDKEFTAFFNELTTLNTFKGYPQECKNIAISNGSLNGYTLPNSCFGQDCPGIGSLLFGFKWLGGGFTRVLRSSPGDSDFDKDGKSCFYYESVPYDFNENLYLNVGTLPYDHIPGGTFHWYTILKEQITEAGGKVFGFFSKYETASFISTLSALDLSTNDPLLDFASYGKQKILDNSPFDDIWWDTKHNNEAHTAMSRNLSNWIETQIEAVENNNDIKTTFLNKKIDNKYVNNQYTVHKASNSLTLGNTLFKVINKGNLKAYAGSEIILKNGFEVGPTGTFHAKILNITQSKNIILDNLPHLANTSPKSKETKDTTLQTLFLIKDTIVDNYPFIIPIGMSIIAPTENMDSEQVTFYPNPTKDNIYINNENILQRVLISDEFGNIIKEFVVNEVHHKIDLTDLTPNIYFLTIISETESKKFKIIKI